MAGALQRILRNVQNRFSENHLRATVELGYQFFHKE